MSEEQAGRETGGKDVNGQASQLTASSQPARAARQVMRAVVVAVVFLALGYVVFCWSMGQARIVYLVNGLEIPYVARIDGKEHHMGASTVQKVRVREGDLRVEMVDANTSATLPAETVSIRTSLLKRPFERWTFLVNPDRTALFQVARVFYMNRARVTKPQRALQDKDSEPVASYAGATTLVALRDVDYPFTQAPESIPTHSGSKIVTQKMVTTVAGEAAMTKAAMLNLHIGKAEDRLLEAVTRQHILFHPDDAEYYVVLQRVARPESRIEFLKPLLAKRPVIVVAHRAYQGAMEEAGMSAELEKEYAAFSAAAPGDRDLLYLHGRACADWRAGLELVKKATAGDAPHPQASLYLSSWMLSNGQFSEAADLARKAAATPAWKEKAEGCLLDALILGGQYDDALKLVARLHAGAPVERTMSQIEILCAMGKPDRARDAATSAIQDMMRDLPGFVPERHGNLIMAYLESGLGNAEKFVKHARESGSPELELVAELTSGNLARAEGLAAQYASRNVLRTHLLMFVALSRDGKTSSAQEHLQKALSVLEQGDRTDRAIAATLSGKPAMSPDQLVTAQYERPATKALILTALGLVDKPNREICFSLARKLNSPGSLYYLLLRSVL